MVLATAEAVALYLVGFASVLPLAPQVVAPAPFGAYHDLRWVFTFGWSWFSVGWQLAALLAFRTMLSTALTLLAWPDDVARPSLPAVLGRNAFATLVTIVVLSPWATLAFASSAVSYSWFMLGSILAVAATALVAPAVAVAGAWWRRTVPWRAMLFGLVGWLALMVEALAIHFAPGALAVVAAAASGALNALLWQHQVITVLHAPARRSRVPLAPLGLLGVLALFLVGGGFAVGGSVQHGGAAQATVAAHLPRDVALLYVPGYASSYDGRPFRLLGVTAWHFSYAGLAGDRPAPYAAARTRQSVFTSAHLLAAQVAALHRASGAPVVLLADSEGSLVVRAYLEAASNPPVRMFIEASPLIRAGRVYFPSAGHTGFGLAGGWEARELLRLLRLENPGFDETADQPFVRSVVDRAGALRGRTMCPAAAVPVFAFVPFEGALTVYDRPVSHVAWTAVPGYHATLLGNPGVQRDVARLIRTGTLPRHAKSTAAFPVISGAAAAWQVPALPLSLRSGWRSAGVGDAAFSGWRCPASSQP